MHSFLDIAVLHWLGFLNSETSFDLMGHLQDVQMEIAMWVEIRVDADDLLTIAARAAEKNESPLSANASNGFIDINSL